MAQVPATTQLSDTWMTGMRSSGLNTVEKVDDSTIAISGEIECNNYAIQYRNLKGETVKTIDIGVCQVRAFCIFKVETTKYLVLTKQDTVELRNAETGRLLDRLKIAGFDPCALCVTGWDSLLIANWAQETPNMEENDVQSTLIEMKIVAGKLKQQDRKLNIDLSCIVGLVRVFVKMAKIIIMTSYNNDVILAIDYQSGNRLWKMNQLDYEGAVIRPNALISDNMGHIFVADTGLSYCRVFVIASGGRIVKKLLDTAGWCDDLAWIANEKKLVVLHDKSGTDKQDVSVYTITYKARN